MTYHHLTIMLHPAEQQIFRQFSAGIIFLLLLFMVVWLGRPARSHDSSHLSLNAIFQTAGGIEKGSSVRLAGVKIGEVAHINSHSTTNHTVVIVLHITHPDIISNQLPIPNDSSVRIVTPGLFSDKELTIEPGASLEPLQNGDSFLFTQHSFPIDDLLRYLIDP